MVLPYFVGSPYFPELFDCLVKRGNWLWLQGERKISFLIGISLAFTLHIVGVYWWYRNDELLYPLIMFPPKGIPPFWHAMFVIVVNGKSFSP